MPTYFSVLAVILAFFITFTVVLWCLSHISVFFNEIVAQVIDFLKIMKYRSKVLEIPTDTQSNEND